MKRREFIYRWAWWLLAIAGLLCATALPSTPVLAQDASFTITAGVGSGQGTISPSGAVVVGAGGSQTFVVTANPGYKVAFVQVDGKSQGMMTTFTFTNVTANHTILVGFVRMEFTIDARSSPNGQLSPKTLVVVECGDNQTFTMTPNAGYRIADVVVDDASLGPLTSYTFTNVWKNHTISVTFVSLQTAPTVTGLPSGPGVTDLAGLVSAVGLFLGDVHAASADNKASVTVAQGTTGRLSSGEALGQIAIVPTTSLPERAGFVNVGTAYDILPDTAVLDRDTNIAITYDPAQLPPGVDESELCIAAYERGTGSWTTLAGVMVNTSSHSVSAVLSRFATCVVVAPLRAAAFTVKDLQISPNELHPGDKATVGVTVTNNGGVSGTFAVVLKVNGVVDNTKDVTLAAGASERVEFPVVATVAGALTVSVKDLSATLTVAGAPAASTSGNRWLPLAAIAVGLVGTAALVWAFLLWRRGRKRVPIARPAAFGLTDLEMYPKELRVGESTTIAVTVTNAGDHAGTHKVVLRIDGRFSDAKDVTVPAGTNERVEFVLRPTVDGVFRVAVGDMSDTLTVTGFLPSSGVAGKHGLEARAPK